MVSYVMVIHLMLTQEGFIQSEFVRIEFLFTRPPAQSSSLYFESVTTFLCPMGLPDCLDCPDHHQCAELSDLKPLLSKRDYFPLPNGAARLP